MPRLQPVQRDTADSKTVQILDAVQAKLGKVPNIISTMAQSPSVANAYLSFSQALGEGSLPASLREQIALAVGEANDCQYCVSAHSMIGKHAGLNDEQLLDARRGHSNDPKEAAALAFARLMVEQRGHVNDEAVNDLIAAGYTQGEVGEITANVALNLFTNYFNHVADTEIDFPQVASLANA